MPERPALTSSNLPPVVERKPPPITVRLCQLAWIFSIVIGAFAIVYAFIIRESQLPLLNDTIRKINDARADETYDLIADILFWALFGALVVVVMMNIIFLMSFMNRRPSIRWWQFTSILLLSFVVAMAFELLGKGERGLLLRQVLLVMLGLAVLALLLSLLPPVLRWSRARIDVRRGPIGPAAGSEF